MNESIQRVEELRTRIFQLEEKVQALRISRRILLNLLDISEKEKTQQVQSLTNEKERLQKDVFRYTNIIITQNQKIAQLEQQIKNFFDYT